MVCTRLTYRRKLSYNTRGNRVKIVRTPGNRQVYHHLRKRGGKAKCGDCKIGLQGLICVRPGVLARLTKRKKTVNRVYGGTKCHKCVKTRVIRAFLIEEQKIVYRVLKAQGKNPSSKKTEKPAKKAATSKPKSKSASKEKPKK